MGFLGMSPKKNKNHFNPKVWLICPNLELFFYKYDSLKKKEFEFTLKIYIFLIWICTKNLKILSKITNIFLKYFFLNAFFNVKNFEFILKMCHQV